MHILNTLALIKISGGNLETATAFSNLKYHVEYEINPAMSHQDLLTLAEQTGIPSIVIKNTYNQSCEKGAALRVSLELSYSLHELADPDEIYADFLGFPLNF